MTPCRFDLASTADFANKPRKLVELKVWQGQGCTHGGGRGTSTADAVGRRRRRRVNTVDGLGRPRMDVGIDGATVALLLGAKCTSIPRLQPRACAASLCWSLSTDGERWRFQVSQSARLIQSRSTAARPPIHSAPKCVRHACSTLATSCCRYAAWRLCVESARPVYLSAAPSAADHMTGQGCCLRVAHCDLKVAVTAATAPWRDASNGVFDSMLKSTTTLTHFALHHTGLCAPCRATRRWLCCISTTARSTPWTHTPQHVGATAGASGGRWAKRGPWGREGPVGASGVRGCQRGPRGR